LIERILPPTIVRVVMILVVILIYVILIVILPAMSNL
jgi:phage shock protein PspC (stress-responsive transcriptional regulator)